MQGNAAPPTASPTAFRRWLPLAVIVAAIAAAFALRLDRYLSFEALAANREWLVAEVQRLGIWAALIFIVVYAAGAALSLPACAVGTIAGGFLFGIVAGTIAVVIAATAGATVIFLIARTAFGGTLRARAGPFAKKLEAGFRANALSYLLVLRLVPLFPFWLVNLVPALLGVKLGTYVIATAIGIIPGTLVYASLGDGLGALLDRGERPDLGIIFEPRFLLPIAGLAALALVPVAYRAIRSRAGRR
jgi:uncharacterized membrane protein YdjX (TVP38/TMEM64 family)